jgi:DNA (cytosine-5)-methyltransferase 1
MNHEPTHLDLFSGIGGFALAAKWAEFRTIAFCEIDKYCQKVLAKNFHCHSNGNRESNVSVNAEVAELPSIHENIFDLDGIQYRGVDLITGGFPCQPFSVAGKQRGAADDRAIWPEMFRVIDEARPAWVLGENVPGIIPMELDNALSDLEGIGYACWSFVIPACAVDARHRRDRLWIVGRKMADSDEQGLQGRNGASVRECADEWTTGSGDSSIPDASRELLNGNRRTRKRRTESADCCRWLPEPDVGRVAHGIPSRVDRLKGLGNAIVPQVAYEILREIRKLI